MNKKNKLTKIEREAFAVVGRIGGKATVKKRGKQHMAKIGRLGAESRWKNKKTK